MGKHDLGDLLQQVRTELDGLDDDADESQVRLEGLLASLQHRLDNPREDNEDDELLESLSELLARYETEHPRLTDLLNRIIVSLGSMGI